MIVVPNAVSLDALTELVSVGNLLDGAKLALYQSDTPLDRDTVLADLTEADFTGYAASLAIAWATPFVDEDGEAIVPGDLKEFTAGSPLVTSNVIYGYMVIDSGATKLLFVEAFDAPVTVAVAGKTIAVLPVFGAVSQAPA